MVKKGKKDFKSGLDVLIQKTTEREDLEIFENEEKEIKGGKDFKESKDGKGAKAKERQITITIPDNLKRSVKKYCAAHDITIKDLVINSVNKYMKDNGG